MNNPENTQSICWVLKHGLLAFAISLLATGCASLATSPSETSLNGILQTRGGPTLSEKAGSEEAEMRVVETILSNPLNADNAVRIAMLRSPQLKQHYASLGLARADVLEAVEIGNPGISFSKLKHSPGDGVQRTLGFALPLADLMLVPSRARLAKADFERARLDTAKAVFDLALDVESAWYGYISAQQVSEMRAAVANAAQISADLAERFYAAGNISELQLNQERASASEARIQAGQAKIEAAYRRLLLNNLMGLDSRKSPWTAQEMLPLPPASDDEATLLIGIARERNFELLAARQQLLVMDAIDKSNTRWRWFGGPELGYERERDANGERLKGPSLSLELPIFNQGQAKQAQTKSMKDLSQARLQEAELAVENSIQTHVNVLQMQREAVSTFREALIPQREKILQRSQQAQNFMLIGVFELIQAKTKEYDAYQGYLEAIRDYWQARISLIRLVGERLPSDAGIRDSAPTVKEILGPAQAMPEAHHHHHDMSAEEPEPETDHSGHDMPKTEAGDVDSQPKDKADEAHHHKGVQS